MARRLALATSVALLMAAAVVLAMGRDGASTAASTESWGSLRPAILERTEVGAARIGDRIYVVGGFLSSGGTTGRLERYDISEDRWRELAELPIAVNHPGVAAARGRLYLVGGNSPAAGGESKSKRLYGYRPAADRWTRLADAPTARAALSLSAVGARLYAIGGYTELNQTVRRLEIYDLGRDRWKAGPSMPTGRNHVAAAALGARIYVTGGRPGPDHGGLSTVERYDTRTDRWASLAPMPTARSGHAAVAAGGRLVVFGGEELDGGQTIEQVEAYDPAGERWSALPEMLTPRHGLGGVVKGARVYAVEGGPEPGLAYSGALEFLDLP